MAGASKDKRSESPYRAKDIARQYKKRPPLPLSNYSLSTVCPACTSATTKIACKVKCPRCGFTWDCSEL